MTARTKKPAVESGPAVEPTRPPCERGCGGFPKSAKGRYLPGHDARFHATQRAAGAKVQFVNSAEKRAMAAATVKARRAAARQAAPVVAPDPGPEVPRIPLTDQVPVAHPVPVVTVTRTRKAKAS